MAADLKTLKVSKTLRVSVSPLDRDRRPHWRPLKEPARFGGGQVDIVSGKFVFACTEAYKVEKGKIVAPIKGATLIGDGPTVLTRVIGIGNDMALDEGIGMCGKGGQSVPAGVGQPTLLVDGITVGGTA